jgi:HlyD family secretion protein
VQSAYSALDKTVLRSPIAGVITKQDAKLGQIVTVTTSAVANSALISIISQNRLEIETNVPEVDIGRVSTDNPVAITFDALLGETFSGKVVKIDPAETVVEGVVNYKVTILFNDGDNRVKSGLTANLSIKTASKTDVLTLPQYAIVEKDAGTFVRVPVAGGFRDDAVTLGLRSADGTVEIITGVTEGETVVNVGYKTAP